MPAPVIELRMHVDAIHCKMLGPDLTLGELTNAEGRLVAMTSTNIGRQCTVPLSFKGDQRKWGAVFSDIQSQLCLNQARWRYMNFEQPPVNKKIKNSWREFVEKHVKAIPRDQAMGDQ